MKNQEQKSNIDQPDVMPRFFINEEVMTPDGKGIVKRIEELYCGKIGYTCLLEKPYKVIDPYQNTRDYVFPKYSFGYMYSEGLIKI